MRRKFYAPVKLRKDGSIYTDRNYSIKKFFANALMIFTIPVLFVAIVMFALIDPFNTHAQRFEKDLEISQISNISDLTVPDESALSENHQLQNMPSIFPVNGRLTSGFGLRRNPLPGTRIKAHKGIDIAVPTGTTVVASGDGEIIFAGYKNVYGKVIVIRHSDNISTYYAHLSAINVRLSQTVKQGDEIGKSGSTGRSTGPHLHYEVRVDNIAVNPYLYLPADQ